MGTAVFIGLIAVATVLFLAVQKNWISDKTLQRWANVATVVALIAAALVFIVPAPTLPEPMSESFSTEPADTHAATAVPPTPMPTRTTSPTSTPSCPAVSGPFAAAWGPIQGELGCATGSAISGFLVEENFEGGKMFWREPVDYAQALVLFNSGTWQIFEHSPYVEGSPEFSCPDANTPAQCPPTPKRGFGMMWCDIPEIRSGLGNATDCERGYQGSMQQFERGFMLQTDSGIVYVFYSNKRWERR